jgi:hypothetical protein
MRKISVIIIIVILLAALSITLWFFFLKQSGLESAIGEYESGDFIDSIMILNKLIPVADYDTAEKSCYYRCRSINRLAERLERKYDSELKAVSLENRDQAEREKEKRYIEKKLTGINDDIQGDLSLIIDKRNSRIISKGKFYDDFIARYRGSRYIEDLDFEELEKLERTEKLKLLNAIANFYSRYPGTAYISQLVKMIFDNLQKGGISLKGRDEFLRGLIIDYGRRYPTSSEIHRLYTCMGENVNMRNSPGVEGKIVGKIEKDSILIQLEKSIDTAQVGEIRDYWYRVADFKGLNGWIFGKFLAPFDISKYKTEVITAKWSMEENFREWTDSNTPRNWNHVDGGEMSSITFVDRKDSRIIKINSPKGNTAGLFRRTAGSYSFSIQARARFISGDSMTLFAWVTGGDKTFMIKISGEEIDVSGRKIPIHASDWHEYLLSSDDGKFARVYIDGELVSSRIPPVKNSHFRMKGLYCLHSSAEESSSAEIEYIKVR